MKSYFKSIWLLLLVISSFSNAAEYKPITNKDRSKFLQSYKAVYLAAKSGKCNEIGRFIPAIQKNYESILIDPKNQDLVAKYNNLDTILRRCSVYRELDSLMATVENSETTLSKIKNYQEVLTYLTENKIDSLFEVHFKILKVLIRAEFDKDPTMEKYSQLLSFRYSDTPYIISKKEKITEQLNDSYLKLTSTLDSDSIQAFMEKYPGIYDEDMNSLLEKSKTKTKTSLLRNPSIKEFKKYTEQYPNDLETAEKVKSIIRKKTLQNATPENIEEYYSIFSKEDKDINKAFERNLYQLFVLHQTYEDAGEYLHYFPSGTYSYQIRGWLEAQARIDEYVSNGYKKIE